MFLHSAVPYLLIYLFFFSISLLVRAAYTDYLIILQAWNTQTNADLSLSGPVGQVYAVVVGSDMLFAGTQVVSSVEKHIFLFFFPNLWLLIFQILQLFYGLPVLYK